MINLLSNRPINPIGKTPSINTNTPVNPIYGKFSLNQNTPVQETMKNKIQEMKNKASLFYSNQKLLNKTKLSQMRASKKDV